MRRATLFLRIALPLPLRRLFDYLPPQDIDPKDLILGARVRVPFQSRQLIGMIVEIVNEASVPQHKLKRAIEILDKVNILPADVYKLCSFAANYYHVALGEALTFALPALLRKGKLVKETASFLPVASYVKNKFPFTLNSAQEEAVSCILSAKESFQVFLLDGVTGSGKTEVYLRTIFEILQAGKQILVLVPEISLTPQTIERFRARFAEPIVALHSGLSEKERFAAWLKARSGEARIVIGTRSAIFTAFSNLGLIIIDEEHDVSFKQQDKFRYHARDLSIMRASINKIPIILGSATPSLESLLNVKRKRYVYLQLSQRAGNASLPTYQVFDLRTSSDATGLSLPLLQAMQNHLAKGNQVLLFLNRRGFAPVLYCTDCHWIAGCHRCDARMVYHRKPLRLKCHHCDTQCELPTSCLQCGKPVLRPIGLGTQRIEQILKKQFPHVPIIRIDRDNTRQKDAMQTLLSQVNLNQAAILVGTQMLAKGHHFENVTLVGIVDADSGFLSADFRAAEQMGQLLVQVAGRAGRASKKGTVIVQTHHPDHPLLKTLLDIDYQAFAENLLKEREQTHLPPFVSFTILRAEAYKEKNASDFLLAIKDKYPAQTNIHLLGPVPAQMAKRKGLHRQHLLIKAKQRSDLQQFLKTILGDIEKIAKQYTSVKWTLDVDPMHV